MLDRRYLRLLQWVLLVAVELVGVAMEVVEQLLPPPPQTQMQTSRNGSIISGESRNGTTNCLYRYILVSNCRVTFC